MKWVPRKDGTETPLGGKMVLCKQSVFVNLIRPIDSLGETLIEGNSIRNLDTNRTEQNSGISEKATLALVF